MYLYTPVRNKANSNIISTVDQAFLPSGKTTREREREWPRHRRVGGDCCALLLRPVVLIGFRKSFSDGEESRDNGSEKRYEWGMGEGAEIRRANNDDNDTTWPSVMPSRLSDRETPGHGTRARGLGVRK